MNADMTVPPRLDEIELLEETLRRQLEGHRKLLGCIERNREAVRLADIEQIAGLCREQNGIVQYLAELEKARLALVGRLTERLDPAAEKPLPLKRIVETLDGPPRERISNLSEDLRSAIGEVRKSSAVVRGAADALSRHMSGLMQTMQAALGRALVYGRRGRLETRGQNQYCLDIRS